MNLVRIGNSYIDNDDKKIKCIYVKNEQFVFQWINPLGKIIIITRNSNNGYHDFRLLQYTDDEYCDTTDDEYLSDINDDV